MGDREDGPGFTGRTGRYLLLRDRDGLRHAIRSGSILAISDADGSEGLTVILLPGGRILVVPIPLDEILGWLD
jgi:hypothetical protein